MQSCKLLNALSLSLSAAEEAKMPTLTKLYSMGEASKHNTSEDCWIIIDGKVYDVSTYLDDHPGGDDVILATTGKDATDEFEDAGHSKTARELMETFCIGELEETASLPNQEAEIVSKDLPQKALNFCKQYWYAPATVAGLSLVLGYLYLRKKHTI